MSDKPSLVRLYAVRTIDSASMGGERVKIGSAFRVEAQLADSLVASGKAVPYAERPKNAR